jgi:demethylmenaquinone methyltransferase/2-methoxy-6-polyprenyl-1,4-benzoquinol methylase
MGRASLAKDPHEVAAMFDGVASRYDRTNTILSFGRDRSWRRATRAALDLNPGDRCLDLAAGTGVSTQELARSGAYAVGVDISLGMLHEGRRARPEVPLLAGDALALPFPDRSVDAVTISFGLRNIVDTAAALAEMARVTRPGGRLVVCEFGHLPWPRVDTLYESYLATALPLVARRLSGSPEAYDYLAESIKDWPAQPELARRMAEAGWSAVRWRNLTLGVVALHLARRRG